MLVKLSCKRCSAVGLFYAKKNYYLLKKSLGPSLSHAIQMGAWCFLAGSGKISGSLRSNHQSGQMLRLFQGSNYPCKEEKSHQEIPVLDALLDETWSNSSDQVVKYQQVHKYNHLVVNRWGVGLEFWRAKRLSESSRNGWKRSKKYWRSFTKMLGHRLSQQSQDLILWWDRKSSKQRMGHKRSRSLGPRTNPD